MMREVFVSELVKEVLGPRFGMNETLNDSPLTEYITGVLSPEVAEVQPDADTDSVIPENDSGSYEDEAGDSAVDTPTMLSPPLNPKSRPASMGISFMVRSEGDPRIHVCVTWARYSAPSRGLWQRAPRNFVALRTVASERERLFLSSAGVEVNQDEAEISLLIVRRRVTQSKSMLSLFVKNELHADRQALLGPEPYIFQPQIRIIQVGSTEITAEIAGSPTAEEEKMLEFLYRNKRIYARGHLCSAIWSGIDPEVEPPDEIILDHPESRNEPPFRWIDGEQLSSELRSKFARPAVRTEFCPIYSSPAPTLSWRGGYGDSPRLEAETLADAWNPEELRAYLVPLASGYERWIGELRQTASSSNQGDADVARDRVVSCESVLQRILQGVNLVSSDENARLAFCFANKALELQSQWTRSRPFVWRPFQLGFFLMSIKSVVDPMSADRDLCDLLWVPTGAGKTEAYLAVAAFAFAFRRRLAKRNRTPEEGVSVLTRYTLRLLTIQQFRRTLALMAACEYLRVEREGKTGWRPQGCTLSENILWGETPFSTGLWVGGEVTPNRLEDIWPQDLSGGRHPLSGAISILRGSRGQGEPAQVMNCPACRSVLAIPVIGLRPGRHVVHFVLRTGNIGAVRAGLEQAVQQVGNLLVVSMPTITEHQLEGFFTLSIEFESASRIREVDIDSLWTRLQRLFPGLVLESVRPSRPGYFLRHYVQQNGQAHAYDFEIFCGNPACPLRRPWSGGSPAGSVLNRQASIGDRPHGNHVGIDVQTAFQAGSRTAADRIPILAYTVDEQIYRKLPTIVIATADKFARPAFEPRAASLFGNVSYHHCVYGYYRAFDDKYSQDASGHMEPVGPVSRRNFVSVTPPSPPDLILQDELHLIEGSLGSLLGLYETAVGFLVGQDGRKTKYIASTATTKSAAEQVSCIFGKGLQIFPPLGLGSDDRFFLQGREAHALDDEGPGRLYLGICAPGRGPLTPLVRIWARLMQTASDNRTNPDIDPFWTLTGYFNAIRELGGAKALYRQDIPQRIGYIAGGRARPIVQREEGWSQELSGRTPSTELPAILEMMNDSVPGAQDVLFTTAMFGTGVDIQRLGLMVVNGQPKTTSSYIQSTGRVGRSKKGGLIVTFLRASRPRDLNHYELFCGYHGQLHRFVEPVTVYPFAPGVLDRGAGPVSVFILRTMRNSTTPWLMDTSAPAMAGARTTAPEVTSIPGIFEARARGQPGARRPAVGVVANDLAGDLDHWRNVARRKPGLRYVEYAISQNPVHDVVLGDEQHQQASRRSNLEVVYENAPQSLRDVEQMTGFET